MRYGQETTCALCEDNDQQCSLCAEFDARQAQLDEERRAELGDWEDE